MSGADQNVPRRPLTADRSARTNFLSGMPPRPTNVDGSHFDMRPLTRQALLLFGLVPTLLLTYSLLVAHETRGFGLGLRCGALVGFAIALAGWIRSWRFETRHLDWSRESWERHHRRSLRIAW